MIIIKKFLSIVLIVATALVLLCSCGPKVKNGFVKENGYTYYYVNNEILVGWQEINGDWYFFVENDESTNLEGIKLKKGTMLKDIIIKENEIDYYFIDENGKMVKNKWFNGNYFGSDGKMIRDSKKIIDGKEYVFDDEGNVKRTPNFTKSFAGQIYNFYIKNELPYWIESYNNVWILEDILSMELEPYNNGLHLIIKGVVRHFHGPTGSAEIACRISMKDENGITSSTEVGGKSNSIEAGGVYGEKAYITFDLGGIPFFGGDIDVEFKSW